MYKLAAVILLLSFMAQTFSREFYYAGYYVDNSTYAKNCVNKARPMMHCNGKCQLMRKIAEEEKKQQQQSSETAYKSIVLSSRSSFINELTPVDNVTPAHYSCFNTGSPIDQPSSFFHPPGC